MLIESLPNVTSINPAAHCNKLDFQFCQKLGDVQAWQYIFSVWAIGGSLKSTLIVQTAGFKGLIKTDQREGLG